MMRTNTIGTSQPGRSASDFSLPVEVLLVLSALGAGGALWAGLDGSGVNFVSPFDAGVVEPTGF
jgi:hypothetical protein